MYRIAVCDDEEAEVARTIALLTEYAALRAERKIKSDTFLSGDALLSAITAEQYAPDLLLLDIFMPGLSGIEVAEKLSASAFAGNLIFLTTSKDFALEAYGLNAIQYLVKPIERERLFDAVDRSVTLSLSKRQTELILRIDGSEMRLSARDIVYAESQRNNLVLHLSDRRVLTTRMTMKSFEALLAQNASFVRVGMSYLINLEHVTAIRKEECKLDRETTIRLPRGSYANLRERYLTYFFPKEV